MAEINRESLKKLKTLCRIDFSEDEQESLLHDLQNILNYIELLQEVDTENVKPLNHVLSDVVNVTREDVVGETLPRDLFLKNAPDQIGGLIRVPPVIKKND